MSVCAHRAPGFRAEITVISKKSLATSTQLEQDSELSALSWQPDDPTLNLQGNGNKSNQPEKDKRLTK